MTADVPDSSWTRQRVGLVSDGGSYQLSLLRWLRLLLPAAFCGVPCREPSDTCLVTALWDIEVDSASFRL